MLHTQHSSLSRFMYAQDILEGWEFRQVGTETWYAAQVPGNVVTDLLRHGLIPDPFQDAHAEELEWIGQTAWEYRTTFVIEEKWMAYDQLELVFEGLDTFADIYLNEQRLLSTDNMHHAWRVAVKEHIIPDDFELVFKKEEFNRLRIVFHPVHQQVAPSRQGAALPGDPYEPTPRLSPYARKARYHFGSAYSPRLLGCGIHRKVSFCAWNHARIHAIQYSVQKLEKKYANLRARFEVVAARPTHALFRIKSPNEGIATVMEPAELTVGLNEIELDFEILHPRRWWPNGKGEAHRYLVRGEMTLESEVAQFLEEPLGLRSLRLENDPRGAGDRLLLNEQPLYLKAARWLPPHYFTHLARYEDYERLLDAAVAANVNLLHVWGGGVYESDWFYELCDQKGLLVWHDFMFGEGMYPADDAMQERLRREIACQIKRLRNHPCLALWCGNEGTEMKWEQGVWQQQEAYTEDERRRMWADYQKIFYDMLPHHLARLDEGRLYLPSYPQPEEAQKAFLHADTFPSAPHLATLKSSISAPQLEPGSAAMNAQQVPWNAPHGEPNAYQRIAEGLNRHYPNCSTMAFWAYLSQIQQADYLTRLIEEKRRLSLSTTGLEYGLLHDSWPATSPSSIDHQGRWKAAHYHLRRAFASVLIAPYEQDGQLHLALVSDEAFTVSASLSVELVSLKGAFVRELSEDVQLAPFSRTLAMSLPLADWLSEAERPHHLLRIRLLQGTKELAEKLYYFCSPGELALPPVEVNYTFLHTGEGYQIQLLCNALAKNVFLHLNTEQGFFSNNYFDLLPNVEYTLTLSPAGPELDLGDELTIWSMVDVE